MSAKSEGSTSNTVGNDDQDRWTQATDTDEAIGPGKPIELDLDKMKIPL